MGHEGRKQDTNYTMAPKFQRLIAFPIPRWTGLEQDIVQI